MHSMTVWKQSKSPNYVTNLNKDFPYSEVPYLGEYNLVKIPLSLNKLIDHVDYWGEGRIVSEDGTSGFINCYNINHQYQLVSRGEDRDRKIPNRIPIFDIDNCDTSPYIKDNSVVTVTVMGALMIPKCAADITRIVNNDVGKVIVYGYDKDSEDIKILTDYLKTKGLSYWPAYELPSELKITLFDEYMVFLNISNTKNELMHYVSEGVYDNCVAIAKNIADNENLKNLLNEIFLKIIETSPKKSMAFAYKLWHSGGEDIIKKYFPSAFSAIFSNGYVMIINQQYKQALKLAVKTDSYHDRAAWGDHSDTTSKRVTWKLVSVWENNDVRFKIYNVEFDMYLKLDVNVDNIGDRRVWGSNNSTEARHMYYLEPLLKNEELSFFIINYQYKQGLKLAVQPDGVGDRELWGHNGRLDQLSEARFTWSISAI